MLKHIIIYYYNIRSYATRDVDVNARERFRRGPPLTRCVSHAAAVSSLTSCYCARIATTIRLDKFLNDSHRLLLRTPRHTCSTISRPRQRNKTAAAAAAVVNFTTECTGSSGGRPSGCLQYSTSARTRT